MEDGSKQKNQKSDIVHWLENRVSSKPALPNKDNLTGLTHYIVDGMADVHNVHGDEFKTFDDLAQEMLDGYLNLFYVAEEVHVIFDRYDNAESVKSEERLRRIAGVSGQ